MNYVPVELHSHTNHSDGKFTVDELINNAIAYGYAAIALTDHNTISGHEEIQEKGLHRKIPVIQGIEWTTFYGHMLVINAKKIIDWRTVKPDNIDEHVAEIKKENGIVGIAHPKLIGNPICTGCRWEFNVSDWNQIDFIELWNRVKPDEKFQSEEAYELWRKLLKQGYRIAPSSGKDWHSLEKEDENTAVTYVGIEGSEVTSDAVVESIRNGRMYITLGPQIQVSITSKGQTFQLGEVAKKGSGVLNIEVLENPIPSLDYFSFNPTSYRVLQSEEIIYENKVTAGIIQLPVVLDSGYIRVELFGDAKGKENQRLTITSPIYIR